MADNGASLRDRATRASTEPASGLGHSAGIPSAEPLVLVAVGDPEQTPLLYACSKCGSIHSPAIYLATEERKHAAALEAARDCYKCKTHNNCKYCGTECPKGWLACETCRFAKKLDAAQEVPDDGGPYCAFDGDTYFHELEDAAEAGLEWVSPCHVIYPRIDADSVLDGVLSDMHEDASIDDLDGVDAFIGAVKAFNEAQRCSSWFGDDKRKINVAQAIEARRAETGTGSVHESAVPRGDAPDA